MPSPKSKVQSTALASSVASTTLSSTVVCEGWVLKKRRKKMQGFARRYFTLHQTGILSYSLGPKHTTRDQVDLLDAAITTAPGRKDIHVDSAATLFHLKCLTADDFSMWMSALRKFTASTLRKSSSVRPTPRLGYVNQCGVIIEEMGSTITQLEDAIAAWKTDTVAMNQPSTTKAKLEKEKHRDHHFKDGEKVFGLFKRSGPNFQHPHPEPNAEGNTPNHHNPTDWTINASYQRVHGSLELLKSQRANLVQCVQSLSTSYFERQPAVHGSPVPTTVEEEDVLGIPRRFSAPFSRSGRRNSTSTSLSGSSNSEWFDAIDVLGDGAEEFVMNVPNLLEEREEESKNDSMSGVGQVSDGESDSDSFEDAESVAHALSMEHVREPSTALDVIRRTQLPNGPVGDEGSLFAILKKNVGKDLSTVTFPVTFNEPLTLLQRAAEEVEYYNLLTQAAAVTDPVERLGFVAAFAVSSYAHTRYRSSRKGFNPMLGETFEDSRMGFIAEKVSHNPLVMAYHAACDGWELCATSAGKTKFWGKSLEIIPLGKTHLKIGDDSFVWKRPSSFMRNLLVGAKYLEHSGKMVIENNATNARCVLDFKQSYFAHSNIVSGVIFSPSGKVQGRLEGKWDDQISLTVDSSHFRVLWRMTPFPKNAEEYYGFTEFAITLNEMTSGLEAKLPPTDSRFRPDVKALENGDLDKAEVEKHRVEERQRQRRKQGLDREPRWFKQVEDEWVYAGGYWEERSGGWQHMPTEPLW